MYKPLWKFSILCIIATAVTVLATAQSFYQTNAGRILFTSKAVAPVDISSKDVQQQMELTNKSNLFITVFLKKPLTSYLQELAPGLSPDSLSRIGNYQFSFLVDDRLIYHTELLPGAPRLSQQQQDTTWNKPLIDNGNEGAWWSQFAWNRFMYNGGDSALSDGAHVLRIILRPYVKTSELLVGGIIAEGRLELAVKRKPDINLANTHLSAVRPYDGLPVSRDSFDQDKIKMLKAYIEAGAFRHVTSVVALKNGKILFEEYFNGSGRDSLHDVRSVGKSFASTLTGMALHDHYLQSTGQTIGNLYDLTGYQNNSAAKAQVSLKELLTMSSRFDGNDDDANSPGNEENMYPTDNWVKFVLDLPLDTVKYYGQWHYFTAGVMLLGSTLDKVIPIGLEKYADTKLFKPLHIVNYQWVYTPQHVPSTAGGIRMNALDFAKYGQLYANHGRWQGKQLLPESWVRETFSHQLPITGRKDEFYGYLFWNKMYHCNGQAYETYYCSGNGGNKIFVFKDQPLVVVITATAYGSAYGHAQADRIMEEFVLPAVLGHSK